MLDIRFIRENAEAVKKSMADRNAGVDINAVIQLDNCRRVLVSEVEKLKAAQNRISKETGLLVRQQPRNAAAILEKQTAKANGLKDEIVAKDQALHAIERQLHNSILRIPNIPSITTPVGRSADDNPVIRSFGEKRQFNFKPKPHWQLGTELGLFDFERGAKIAGSGFPLYIGKGAALERALIRFMLDLHIGEHGYTEVSPPLFCNEAAMIGTGQLPKFAEEMYAIPIDHLFPIPTAEVPLTGMYANEILDQPLPILHVAHTPCFRREAGAAGKHTRGLLRVHQFNKVELVKFTTPESSTVEHKKLTADAEAVLQRLDMHYRIIELCTGDLGFSAAKCYDIELWAPARNQWLEVSSCSNFADYQARRARIRYRGEKKKLEWVHTINGSGVALPRLVASILENNQDTDGSVLLPEALLPYMDGLQKLEK